MLERNEDRRYARNTMPDSEANQWCFGALVVRSAAN
jgi:hypothetical protein